MKRKTSIFDFDLPTNCPQWPGWYIRPKGICLGCGRQLNDKRKKYCSEDCKWDCCCASHDLSVTSIRRFIHFWFHFECQGCGKHFSFFSKAGFEFPIYSGVVHHIIPFEHGGQDEFDNLILVCEECHEQIHPRMECILDKIREVGR